MTPGTSLRCALPLVAAAAALDAVKAPSVEARANAVAFRAASEKTLPRVTSHIFPCTMCVLPRTQSRTHDFTHPCFLRFGCTIVFPLHLHGQFASPARSVFLLRFPNYCLSCQGTFRPLFHPATSLMPADRALYSSQSEGAVPQAYLRLKEASGAGTFPSTCFLGHVTFLRLSLHPVTCLRWRPSLWERPPPLFLFGQRKLVDHAADGFGVEQLAQLLGSQV